MFAQVNKNKHFSFLPFSFPTYDSEDKIPSYTYLSMLWVILKLDNVFTFSRKRSWKERLLSFPILSQSCSLEDAKCKTGSEKLSRIQTHVTLPGFSGHR